MKTRATQINLIPRHQEILALARQGLSVDRGVDAGLPGVHFADHPSRYQRTVLARLAAALSRRCRSGFQRRECRLLGSPGAEPQRKVRIAQMVAQQIPDNASLFINIGTTTEEVAKALCGHKNLRVITNNLNVATQLSDNSNFEVIVAGGVVERDRGVIGESTIDFIRQFKVDFGIIGISGVDLDGTLLISTTVKYASPRRSSRARARFSGHRPYQVQPQSDGPPWPHLGNRCAVYRRAAAR